MKLDLSTVKIVEHKDAFTIKIMMPDGSGNYLHTGTHDIESVIVIRDLIMDQEIYDQQISIVRDEGYYRLILTVEDCNHDKYEFHSRKLNLNDALFERDQLLMDYE